MYPFSKSILKMDTLFNLLLKEDIYKFKEDYTPKFPSQKFSV